MKISKIFWVGLTVFGNIISILFFIEASFTLPPQYHALEMGVSFGIVSTFYYLIFDPTYHFGGVYHHIIKKEMMEK